MDAVFGGGEIYKSVHKKWICIQRFKDKNIVLGYRLLDRNSGEIKDITPQELKLHWDEYTPKNLTLTKDNKILYKHYIQVNSTDEIIKYNEAFLEKRLYRWLNKHSKLERLSNDDLNTFFFDYFQCTWQSLNFLLEGYHIYEYVDDMGYEGRLQKFKDYTWLMHTLSLYTVVCDLDVLEITHTNYSFEKSLKLLETADIEYECKDDIKDLIKLGYAYKNKHSNKNLSVIAYIILAIFSEIIDLREFLVSFIKFYNKKIIEEYNSLENKQDIYNWLNKGAADVKEELILTKTRLILCRGCKDAFYTRENGDVVCELLPYSKYEIEDILNK